MFAKTCQLSSVGALNPFGAIHHDHLSDRHQYLPSFRFSKEVLPCAIDSLLASTSMSSAP